MKKCQREEHCINFIVRVRKNADTNSTKGKWFLDTHLMKNQLLSDDKHHMKNYQIVLKNSIIDGVDKARYF